MPTLVNVVSSAYASNSRNLCYDCDKPNYDMRACPNINMLINKEVIHWDNTDWLCWDKENISGMFVRQTYRLVWKDNILKQAKNQEIMTETRVNVNLIQAADATIKVHDTIRN